MVAFFHWGLSQQTTVSQRYPARAAVDAGANVVVGHHPHILQGIERYKDAPILYSLGNFVFDLRPHFFGPMTNATAIARIGLSSGAVARVELLPVWIGDDGRPFRLPPQDSCGVARANHPELVMAKSRTHHIGRLVTVVLEPGEPLLASVAQVASSMGISFASVSFRANLTSARLILGRRRYSRRARDPDRVSFDDGRKVVGNGHITQSESGSVEVALRCAVGREREVFVADIVEATVGDGATLTLAEGLAAT